MEMNGLRVYLNVGGVDTRNGQRVFYSRRADGPYYRWWYEEKLGQWRGSRVHASDFTPRALSMASWKVVPMELQARLDEHYLE